MAGLTTLFTLTLCASSWAQKQKPIGEAVVSKPLVDSEALQARISGQQLLASAEELFEIAKLSQDEYNRPTRVIGSKGHEGTLKYILETLEDLGDYYNVSQQQFTAVSGQVFESRLVLGDSVVEANALSLTPPTPKKEPVHGDLVLVENEGCEASDYGESVSGNVAFVSRGTCSFGIKSGLAGKAGALAAIVYNNENGSIAGTLGSPSPDHVATFGLSREVALPFVQKLQHGEKVSVTAFIDSVINEIATHNIVAQTVDGDADNCVMLGGHSDSVDAGPGINDDGSGSLSLLAVARELVHFGVKNCVRFGWFSGEEEGLLGSDAYVSGLSEVEKLKIRLFMDYDMMASPNFAYQIYNATDALHPKGSEALRDLYVAWYSAHGLNYTFVPFDGRSDYDGFIRSAIPAGGVVTGAEGVKTAEEAAMFGGQAGQWYDPCYHQLCDDIGNLNVTAWLVNTKLIAHSVATYARSLDKFPQRSLSELQVASYEPRYHGSRLVL